jgi:predicted XRE-type DNA-binding protein
VQEVAAPCDGNTWRAGYEIEEGHRYTEKRRSIASTGGWRERDATTTGKGETEEVKPRTVRPGRRVSVTEGSERELLKARLTLQIHSITKERGLTRVEAAELLGIRQPQVSLPIRNRSGSFSVGRLMELLTALGRDVEIAVRPARKKRGQMYVVAA